MNQSQANNLKPMMKPKGRPVGKDFKLIDFQTLDFSPNRDENSSVSSTETKKQVNQFHIQMFGLNETGDTCSITITDFHPFFYIQVANSWEQHDAEELLEHIKVKVGYFKTSILSIKIVDYNKLYGFTGGKKSRFAMIQFKNMAAFNKTKNLWYEYNSETNKRNSKPFIFKNTKLHLYESNIPPLLRYFHILNISPSGWVFVHTNHCETPDEKTTTCKYEWLCSKKYVRPAAAKENLAPYKICSFDIEASSSHGDFPLPKKTYKRLSSNIVDVFQNQLVATNGSIKTNPSRIMQLLTRIIMTAFGFDSFEDVDTIYPIESPSKEQVKSLLENFFSVKIDLTAKNSGGEDEDTTIEEIFEKLKQNTYSGGAAAEGDGDDDCEDEDGCGAGADAHDVDDSDDQPVAAAAKKGPTSKMVANNSHRNTGKPGNHTVIDILLSDETRDTKIQQINVVFKRAGFPKIEGDKVTFIGSTFLKYGQTEPYLNHCLVLGSCDNIPGIEVQTAPTEQELLTNWTELIQRENPDIIIGYNIFGFDYEFMYQRAMENKCCVPFLELSRKKEIWEGKNEDDPPSLDSTTIQIASGEYDLRYPKMVGRLQIDMYTYFRRDFNLSSYKLDDVAGEFICDKILKTVVVEDHGSGGSSEVTQLYSKNLAGLNVGDFIHIKINGFSSDYYNNGQKFPVLKIDYNVSVIETNKSGVETTNTYNIISIQGNHMFDKSANIEWAMSKDDVTPQDIFRLSNGTSSDRAIVAKYCIQDCNLVHHLMSKIDVITGYVEMSRICSVPISFLIFRGQGIKLTSYVAKKCREKNTLMPDLEKTYSEDGYEGAIVLPPKCSMYIDNPVACVDYSSLYPSSMISQNYSHDSKVWSKEYDLNGHLIKGSDTGEKDAKGNYVYDNLPGYEYINIEFDTYKYLRPAGKPMAKKVKTKVGKKICRWAQLPGGQKSIMPSILEELLKARADTRKKIKTEPDAFMRNILDKRQNGYKVTANSLYGQCGARTSTFYEQDVAASTTATGRTMITYAKRMIEEVYGDMVYDTAVHGPVRCRAEYVYGDSVANYTPVKIRVNKSDIEIITIEQLAKLYGGDKWIFSTEEGKQTKEFCELTGIESWTESGWTPLYRVIRHALHHTKKMIRVLTHTGLVDVTDDHSLLQPNGVEISPNNCYVGTPLLHHSLLQTENETNYVSKEEAYVMGFFFGDGSCGSYNCPSGKKSSWALNNACIDIIEKCLENCRIAYPNYEWTVLDTLESSGVYKICPKNSKYGSIREFVKTYRAMMYYESSKIIPNVIMNSSIEIRQAFWDGMYDADGDKDINGNVRIDQKNQISASHIAWLATSLGWKTSINTRSDKLNIYRITMTKKSQRKNPFTIKKMHEIEYSGYVYDLTTENHHFAAGIGNLIVHNTDSVFFTFNLENPETGEKIRGKPALEMTIEIAQDVAHLCTSFLKPPMSLAYEKTLMPFILLSKKRYVGMLYEEDPNKGKLKYMGLVLKRRDNCDLVKDVYGGVLQNLMNNTNIEPAIQFLNKCLEDLIKGNIGMDKLAITKSLRSDYKNPQQIAHRVLADRIGQRDPGNKPKPGDRIKYLFITNKQGKLQGEKIETPEFITHNKLQIDYTYYITNQLMKPLLQLFGLAIEQIWEMQNKKIAIKAFRGDIQKMSEECEGDLELFMKKREKYTSTKVKTLLFEKFLTKIYNEQNKIQTIQECFFRKR
jgi:DNA polymerase elongation subunit (family B)